MARVSRIPAQTGSSFHLESISGLRWAGPLASTRITISHGLHHPVVAMHLISLTVGFGAVPAVDVCALSGLLRRHDFTLADAIRAAGVVDPLIWLPRSFAVRAVAAALLSQLAWWTAIFIGFFGI